MILSINEIAPNNEMKDFKDFKEIIRELEDKKDRPLSFDEQEIKTANTFFKTTNYYSFAIYRKMLPRIEGKNYSFSDCLKLYNFNTFLRVNLNHFTGQIEMLLRATLIQQLCKSYDRKKNENKIKVSRKYIEEIVEKRGEELVKKIIKTANKDTDFDKLFQETEKKMNGSYSSILKEAESIAIKYSRELADMSGYEAIEEIELLMKMIVETTCSGIQKLGTIGIEIFQGKLNEKNIIPNNDFRQIFAEMISSKQEDIKDILKIEKKRFLEDASQREPSNMYRFKPGQLYLDKAIYKSQNEHEFKEILEDFFKVIKESKSDAIKHHRNRDIDVPIWVLFEEITYGTLYHFVVALEEEFKKDWTLSFNEFGSPMLQNSETLILGWFRTVNFLRNECAHYNRLYGRYFTVSPPSLHKQDIQKAGITASENTTLFANMLAVKNLLGIYPPAQKSWNTFLEELDDEILEHNDIIRLNRMGFPENWKECLIL